MLNLDIFAGPRWLDLVAGVSVQVLPLGTTLLGEVWADPAMPEPPEGADEPPAVSPVVFAKAVARHAIIGWRGVGDAAGQEVAVTPAGIDALLEIPAVHAAFRTLYIGPGLQVVAEGNGSAAAPNGISAAAAPTARPARASATPARPASTRRGPSRAGKSGT